jgi:hypothetical protein
VFDGFAGIPEADGGASSLVKKRRLCPQSSSEMGAGGADTVDSLTGCERFAFFDSLTTCEGFCGVAGQAR